MTEYNDATEAILLVDDNPTNLQLLFETLDGRGYKLLIAKDGKTALSITRKAGPNLILLDIMMPGIDGFEVCERLKNDQMTRMIPVFACWTIRISVSLTISRIAKKVMIISPLSGLSVNNSEKVTEPLISSVSTICEILSLTEILSAVSSNR